MENKREIERETERERQRETKRDIGRVQKGSITKGGLNERERKTRDKYLRCESLSKKKQAEMIKWEHLSANNPCAKVQTIATAITTLSSRYLRSIISYFLHSSTQLPIFRLKRFRQQRRAFWGQAEGNSSSPVWSV